MLPPTHTHTHTHIYIYICIHTYIYIHCYTQDVEAMEGAAANEMLRAKRAVEFEVHERMLALRNETVCYACTEKRNGVLCLHSETKRCVMLALRNETVCYA